MIGIYRVYNTKNNKSYVGQSRNLSRRFTKHTYLLNIGMHPNSLLQEDWLKYGESAFQFEILEFCKIPDLDKKEKEHIALLNSTADGNGYNLTYGGIHPAKYSGVTKNKMSGNNKGERNPNYGKHLSDATKQRIRNTKEGERNAAAKLSAEQARYILNSGLSAKELAEKFGVTIGTVYHIKQRKTWKLL